MLMNGIKSLFVYVVYTQCCLATCMSRRWCSGGKGGICSVRTFLIIIVILMEKKLYVSCKSSQMCTSSLKSLDGKNYTDRLLDV